MPRYISWSHVCGWKAFPRSWIDVFQLCLDIWLPQHGISFCGVICIHYVCILKQTEYRGLQVPSSYPYRGGTFKKKCAQHALGHTSNQSHPLTGVASEGVSVCPTVGIFSNDQYGGSIWDENPTGLRNNTQQHNCRWGSHKLFPTNHLVTFSPFLGSVCRFWRWISVFAHAHPEINIKPPQWVWKMLFPPELTATPLTPRTAEGPACTQYCPQRPSTVQEAPRAQLPWQYRMAVENPPCSIADT